MALIDIAREPVYYTAGFSGMDVEQAPLYLQALTFDGEDNACASQLIFRLNQKLVKGYPPQNQSPAAVKQLPQRIIIINTVNDELPLAYETRRIWDAYLTETGRSCFTRIVNSRRVLLEELRLKPEYTLVFSQCGSAGVYDAALCRQLLESGITIIPGIIGAPGGMSDKPEAIASSAGNQQIMAHYRMGTKGIVLESLYVRSLPAPEELSPLSLSILEAAGGEAGLQDMILKGAGVLIKLTAQSTRQCPWRFQVGFADHSITELNGDAARGLCSGSRWPDFIEHSLAWLEDGLAYYSSRQKLSR